MAIERHCNFCDKNLTRNEIGINRKLLENDTKAGIWRCIPCLAEYLEVEEEDLMDKIEEFKAQGCKLFG